ncbi:cyclic nucleotide-binding domain-containing protein [Desulfofustis glycolicus]|uniref:Adenylate cyclase, class 3 n=1 Tax=Desulfofustis glycolicus DSM 9705 TaxID=1121409 RepID=A0A1M5WKG2_9BACT|nr:cyclic nucleotide-binding domain-containing protein [Desulfofustis glycolicus]MCB2216808.1 cyclic nucleotide-binding domain-containing protein [Desulfobulbaceae bacterium]SHH87593.1 Adenylate cyclase, class 3 [Desulfofustis glycolicus DSM 9705]
MKPDRETEGTREVVIMLTDMVGYSRLTSDMTPDGVRDFVVDYHRSLARVIRRDAYEPVEIEPSAGDGALILFGKRGDDDVSSIGRRALAAAVDLGYAVTRGEVAKTRIGLFKGDIVEAQINGKKAKFGAGFAVASRLEELCDYFDIPLLMDRDIAMMQDDDPSLVCIGRVTPLNLNHPLHLLTVYRPGLHHIPADVEVGALNHFIAQKNEAIELFCGNKLLGIDPDFPEVKRRLERAKEIFYRLCGSVDMATERILEYIRDTPYPAQDFRQLGMKVLGSKQDKLGVRLFHLSSELLKAIDEEFYNALVIDTDWENYFALEWRKHGDVIFRMNDEADGIYYINSGSVVTLDENDRVIVTLGAGNIFGEMAYFSRERKRNATVVAASDLVLRKISTGDFEKLPVIQKIFKRIAAQRQTEGDGAA